MAETTINWNLFTAEARKALADAQRLANAVDPSSELKLSHLFASSVTHCDLVSHGLASANQPRLALNDGEKLVPTDLSLEVKQALLAGWRAYERSGAAAFTTLFLLRGIHDVVPSVDKGDWFAAGRIDVKRLLQLTGA